MGMIVVRALSRVDGEPCMVTVIFNAIRAATHAHHAHRQHTHILHAMCKCQIKQARREACVSVIAHLHELQNRGATVSAARTRATRAPILVR